MADISGGGNQQKKVSIISSCLVACKGPEARFLIRSCTGKLRVGVSESTVLAAIARAFHIVEYGKDDDDVADDVDETDDGDDDDDDEDNSVTTSGEKNW